MKKTKLFPEAVIENFHLRCQHLAENLLAERGTAMRVYHVAQDLKYIRDTGTHTIDGYDQFYPWVWAKYRIKPDQANLYLSCIVLKPDWLEGRRGAVKEMAVVAKIPEVALQTVLIEAMHEGAHRADLCRGRDHGLDLLGKGTSQKEAAAQARLVAMGQKTARVRQTGNQRAYKSIGRIHLELTTLARLVEQGRADLNLDQLNDVFQQLRDLVATARSQAADKKADKDQGAGEPH